MGARVTITKGRGSLADGWEYEVVLPNNIVVCSGWVRGTKREARLAAEEHAREKGLTVA